MFASRRFDWLVKACLVSLGILSLLPLFTFDEHSRQLALNTLWLALGTAAISLPLGTLLAVLIVRTTLPGRTVAGTLLAILLFIPLYLQAGAWQAGFGDQGWLTLQFDVPPLLMGWRGAIWVHAMAAVPWVVLIVGLGLWWVEPELEEDALLNASPAAVLARVTLRRAAPAIAAAALWVMISAAGEMTVTDFFMVRTYAEELYTALAVTGDVEPASLTILPGVIIAAWLMVALILAGSLLAPRADQARPPHSFSLRRWRWPATALAWLLVAFLVGVPLVNFLSKAGVLVEQSGAQYIRTWSIAKIVQIVAQSPRRFQIEVEWSLGVGALAASAAVFAAVALAWFARRGGLATIPAIAFIVLGLAMPAPLVGLGIIELFNRPDVAWLHWLYDRTVAAPCLAQAFRALPLATLILWSAFRMVPGELLESAALDGASSLQQLLRVVLPLRCAAVAAAWLVSFAAALAELGATILVIPPGMSALSVRIFGLLHYGVDDQVAGICLVLASLCSAVGLLVVWLARRSFPPSAAQLIRTIINGARSRSLRSLVTLEAASH